MFDNFLTRYFDDALLLRAFPILVMIVMVMVFTAEKKRYQGIQYLRMDREAIKSRGERDVPK